MEAQRIIVTGGATRIGAAIAEKLSGPNKEITVHYNQSKSKAEKLKKTLQKFGTTVPVSYTHLTLPTILLV